MICLTGAVGVLAKHGLGLTKSEILTIPSFGVREISALSWRDGDRDPRRGRSRPTHVGGDDAPWRASCIMRGVLMGAGRRHG